MIARSRSASQRRTNRANPAFGEQLRLGFLAMIPLWPGVASFSVAFAIMARAAGYSAVETQLMSMLVYAGSAQLAMVTLYAGGAGALSIVLTALILNLRHVLYGLSVNGQVEPHERPRRSLLAFFLTDESYGIATREWLAGRGSAAFLLGTGFSLYAVFALMTLAGILFGSLLPDVERSGLDFIFPLSFLALLLPLLTSRLQILVAVVAGGIALTAGQVFDGGVTILLATIAAASCGVLLERGREAG
ncbi:MAG TPA: AzlC family ABC transporter permease [Thermomicrobiales bacterium]|nr:AzlC family ABC transporter permease [Thermomicrobiales bacterium]